MGYAYKSVAGDTSSLIWAKIRYHEAPLPTSLPPSLPPLTYVPTRVCMYHKTLYYAHDLIILCVCVCVCLCALKPASLV